jgi:hypothetical protein
MFFIVKTCVFGIGTKIFLEELSDDFVVVIIPR